MFVVAALVEGGLSYGTYLGWFNPAFSGPLAKLSVLLLVGYGLWANRRLRMLWLVWVGLLLNTVVIMSNGGHMPVSARALLAAGMPGYQALLKGSEDAVHSSLGPNTRLASLSDVIPIARFRQVVSAGDLLIALGIVGVIIEGTRRDPSTPPPSG